MGGAMKIEVKNWDNEVTGKIELPDAVFAREVNQHLVWEVVRAYLASRRRGTHKTKERSDVKGTGSKPWKQKHTGRARAGSRQSPLWRSGGIAHGPRQRPHLIQRARKRDQPRSGNRPIGGLDPDAAAERRRLANRSARVASER